MSSRLVFLSICAWGMLTLKYKLRLPLFFAIHSRIFSTVIELNVRVSMPRLFGGMAVSTHGPSGWNKPKNVSLFIPPLPIHYQFSGVGFALFHEAHPIASPPQLMRHSAL